MSNAQQEIEVTIDQLKESIEMSNRLQQLEKDPLFEEFILKLYLDEKPSQLAGLLAHPGMQEDAKQKELMEEIKAVGFLRQFLMQIHLRADNAERAIEQHREELEMVRAEEAEEEALAARGELHA